MTAAERTKLLFDYFMSDQGVDVPYERQRQLASILVESSFGAELQTAAQLHRLRLALDEIAPLPVTKTRSSRKAKRAGGRG